MSKKILKRSLALGALMAFVITGSAMAAEVVTPNHQTDADKAEIITVVSLTNDGILENSFVSDNNSGNYTDKFIFDLNGYDLTVKGKIECLGLNEFDINGTGSTLTINGKDNFGLSGRGTVDVDSLVINGGCLYVHAQPMTVTTKSVYIGNGTYGMNVQGSIEHNQTGGKITVVTDKLTLENCSSYAFRAAHKGTIDITADEIYIIGENQSKSKANGEAKINLKADKGIIKNDFVVGENDSKGTVNLTLGSGVTLTGSVVTDTASESASNITLNGATWKVTANSNITTLAGNDGKIELAAAPATYSLRSANNGFVTLQIGDASNSGAEITGEGLTEKVESGELTAEEALEKLSDSVEVEKGSATLTLEEGDTVGKTTTTVDAEGNVGTLKQDVNTKAAKVSKAATNLKAHYRAHMNDMNKRMGELRMANGETGVWTRMVRGESEYEGAKMQYNQYQLGYDEKLSVDKRWTVGAAVTFAEGDGSYGQGNTDDKSTAFAIYGSKLNNDGTFVDLIARYAHLESDMEDSVYGNGDYSTNGYSVSAEFGKRIQQGNGLWVEPQVELTYGTIDSANFRLKNGREEYNANFDSMDSFIARVGFSIGKDIKEGNVYARASYLYDFDGETTSLVTTTAGAGTPTPEDFGGGWWEVGVGANINLSKATYIYADIEKTFGGEVDTNWQWNLGVRYSF
ncbi:MAG: autotransporter outer membrane beta-barrel domain-containing protein [Phascolarctobacterium sp.]|nr:autotransporter outer membrane beta-barrel domain-containing protein [Phascolarctobacterium sp.]